MEKINKSNDNAVSAKTYMDKGDTLLNQGNYEAAISEYD